MAFTPGKGTTIAITTASSTTLVTIGQVVTITPPQVEWGEVEVTHLASGWREKIATIREAGPCEATIEWDPANTSHAELITRLSTGADATVRITCADTGTAIVEFGAFLKTFGIQELTVDNVATVNLTFQPSSGISITT